MLKIFKSFIDLLFPIECINCGRENEWICQSCFNKIELQKDWPCPVCKLGLTKGEVCLKCRSKSFLDGAVIGVSYDNKLVDRAIHYLKYKMIRDFSEPLSKILVRVLKRVDFWKNDWILMPVPLHKRRKRWRGFNQAELIGSGVAKKLELNIDVDNLFRCHCTEPQIKLARDERLKNILGAFNVKDAAVLRGKNIILIDDVMTTGATLQECAKILKRAGVNKVWAIVIARGE